MSLREWRWAPLQEHHSLRLRPAVQLQVRHGKSSRECATSWRWRRSTSSGTWRRRTCGCARGTTKRTRTSTSFFVKTVSRECHYDAGILWGTGNRSTRGRLSEQPCQPKRLHDHKQKHTHTHNHVLAAVTAGGSMLGCCSRWPCEKASCFGRRFSP